MKRMISISCAALAVSVALASVPAFAQDKDQGGQNVQSEKMAQGPSGLNFGAAPAATPQYGTMTGVPNPPTAPTRPVIPGLPGGPQPSQPYH